MYELLGLYIAIGGQYVLLFSLYRTITRLTFETRLCPHHPRMPQEE